MTEQIESIHNTSEQSESAFLKGAERVTRVHDAVGFYPHSKEETSATLALIRRSANTFPVLQHFNEVTGHLQRLNRNDGGDRDVAGAIHAIAHQYETYAGNALNEVGYAQALQSHLRSDSVSPSTVSFQATFPVEDWRYDTAMRASLKSIARRRQVEQYSVQPSVDIFAKHCAIDGLEAEELVETINMTLAHMSKRQIREMAQDVEGTEQVRFEYWTSTLEQARRHIFARSVADVALHYLFSQ